MNFLGKIYESSSSRDEKNIDENMTTSIEQLENLKRKVRKAFADVPYPKGEIVSHECNECNEVKKTFLNKNWQQIQLSVLDANYDKLPLFSPLAFHYFLPAYLVYSLERFEENFNETLEFTVYALTPDKEIKENPSWWQDRFKNFTEEQFNLIYEILDVAKKDENFKFFITNIERGKERLKEFVEPNIKGKTL